MCRRKINTKTENNDFDELISTILIMGCKKLSLIVITVLIITLLIFSEKSTEHSTEKLVFPSGFTEKLVFPSGFTEKLVFPTGFTEKLVFPTGFTEKLVFPTGLTTDSNNNLYVSNFKFGKIYRIDVNENIESLFSDPSTFSGGINKIVIDTTNQNLINNNNHHPSYNPITKKNININHLLNELSTRYKDKSIYKISPQVFKELLIPKLYNKILNDPNNKLRFKVTIYSKSKSIF